MYSCVRVLLYIYININIYILCVRVSVVVCVLTSGSGGSYLVISDVVYERRLDRYNVSVQRDSDPNTGGALKFPPQFLMKK